MSEAVRKKAWHEHLPPFWKPVIVLTGLCLLIGVCLALANLLTAGTIAEQSAARKTAASLEVLPKADSFTEVELSPEELEQHNCVDVYRADNGAGYVITTYAKGFKGKVTMIVGINGEGRLTGVSALDNDETFGVGTRALDATYLQTYNAREYSDVDVDALSGATVTSKAVRIAVRYAGEVYELVKEVG